MSADRIPKWEPAAGDVFKNTHGFRWEVVHVTDRGGVLVQTAPKKTEWMPLWRFTQTVTNHAATCTTQGAQELSA